MKALRHLLILLLGCAAFAADSIVTYVDSAPPLRGPGTFREKESGVIYYVESDGRHVSAIAADGKILWHRDPFKEAKLKPYRVEAPKIVWIGPASPRYIGDRKGKYLALSFDSSQFGIFDTQTGNFIFLGQD